MDLLKLIWNQINIVGQCRKNGLSLWQCPQFLFILMGIIIIGATSGTYLIGTKYIKSPEMVALIVIVIAIVLFIISFIITRSFEKLAEASKLKSEFVNIVSHQLRSPLTNIKWTFEVLSSNEFEITKEKQDEYFTNVKENIARMIELVDDLLVVSKIEEGAFSIHKKEINIKEFLNEIEERYKMYAKASDINLDIYGDPKISTLMADSSMLKLVIENLLDNAIRYTRGGGRIEVSYLKRNKFVLFAVKDQGVGIPEKEKKYIFRKFFRAENALRTRTKGSGLGLYVCKTIIKKSGGRIWFKSKENKGTTFYFTLPI